MTTQLDIILKEINRLENEVEFHKQENERLRIQRGQCITSVRDLYAALHDGTKLNGTKEQIIAAAVHNLRCSLHILNLYENPETTFSDMKETLRKMGVAQ